MLSFAFRCVWISATCFVLLSSVALAETRLALVIGNSSYRSLPLLKNAVNDSRLMARILSQRLGYKVIGGDDLDRASMIARIEGFSDAVRAAGPDTVALVFYAGHGMEVADENYLFPIDAVGPFTRGNVAPAGVSLTYLVKKLEGTGSRIKIVILDACRNDGTRSVNSGFRAISTPSGSLVVYSTAPGHLALDGDGGNSPFTSALADQIQTPVLSAEEILFRVQDHVFRATSGRQTPWVKPNLNGRSFSFNPRPDEPTPPVPVAAIRPEQRCHIATGAYAVTGVEVWDHLNVRGLPEIPPNSGSSVSNVTFKLPPNASGIELDSCARGWCRIRYRCMVGWVADRFLTLGSGSPVGVAPFQSRGYFRVTVAFGDVLAVREDPNHLAPLVAELSAGGSDVLVNHCVTPVGTREQWCFVTHQGRQGWSNARYLTKSNH